MLHERFRALGSIWLVRDEGWAGSGRGQDSILWGPMAGFRRQETRLLFVALAATPQTKYLKASVEPGDSLWDRVVSWFLRRCPNAEAVRASWSTSYWWTKAVILKYSHQVKECELPGSEPLTKKSVLGPEAVAAAARAKVTPICRPPALQALALMQIS